MFLSLAKYIKYFDQLVVNSNHRKYRVRILKEKNYQINRCFFLNFIAYIFDF